MLTHRNIDRICAAAVVAAWTLCILFLSGEALGIAASSWSFGYEERLLIPP